MLRFSLKFKGLCLLALFACTIASANARAKAKPWKDDEDDDDWFSSESEEKEEEQVVVVAGKTLNNHDHHEDHHDDHHHGHSNHSQQQNMVKAQNSNWDKPVGGVQNANFAGHNESCGPNRKSCIPLNNLVCSSTDGTGRCVCNSGFVYVRSTETCWPIPKSTEDKCGHDVQCHESKFGSISRCDKRTMVCQCYDYADGLETTLIDGVCYVKKSPGDLCNNHEECDKPIKGAAYCQIGNYSGGHGRNYNGSCQCREDHMWYLPLKKCLKLSSELNDSCIITDQCRKGSLGRLSWCNGNTGHCECKAWGGNNSTETVYYKALKKCFLKKEYNETCEDDDTCRANLGPDVVCGIIDEYPDEKVCHCPKGKTCRNSGFVLASSSSYTLGVCVAAAVVGMTMTRNG